VSKLIKINDTAIVALTTDGFHFFYLKRHNSSLNNHEHIDFSEVIMGFGRNDSISAILATDNIANSKVYLLHNSKSVIMDTINLNCVAQNIKLSESFVYVQTHSGIFRCSSNSEQLKFLSQCGVLDFDVLLDSIVIGVTNDKMLLYNMNTKRLIQERVIDLNGYCCPKLIRCNNEEIGLLVENRINTIEVSSGRVTREFKGLKVFSKTPGVTYVMQEDSTLVKYDCTN
jgi:hypothetical protein